MRGLDGEELTKMAIVKATSIVFGVIAFITAAILIEGFGFFVIWAVLGGAVVMIVVIAVIMIATLLNERERSRY